MNIYLHSLWLFERCPKFACALISLVFVFGCVLPKFAFYWKNATNQAHFLNLQSHTFTSIIGHFDGNRRLSDLPNSWSCFSCLFAVRGQSASFCTWSSAMWQRGLGAVTSLSLLHHLDSSFSPTQLIVSSSRNLLPLSPLRALDKATTAATWRTRWSPR